MKTAWQGKRSSPLCLQLGKDVVCKARSVRALFLPGQQSVCRAVKFHSQDGHPGQSVRKILAPGSVAAQDMVADDQVMPGSVTEQHMVGMGAPHPGIFCLLQAETGAIASDKGRQQGVQAQQDMGNAKGCQFPGHFSAKAGLAGTGRTAEHKDMAG